MQKAKEWTASNETHIFLYAENNDREGYNPQKEG
jgi:hypothetical protein